MSFRREPRTVPDKIADIYAQLRDLHTQTPGAGLPVALYNAKGDILVAAGPSTPQALAVGSDGEFLIADSSAPQSAAWKPRPMTGYPWTGVGI